MRVVYSIGLAGLLAGLCAPFGFADQGGGPPQPPPPPPGGTWQVPNTMFGVSGSLAIGNVTNGMISGTNISASATFTCFAMDPPYTSPTQPPPTLATVTITSVTFYVGSKTAQSPPLVNVLYPFITNPPRSWTYPIRFASTTFENGAVSVWAKAHVEAYYQDGNATQKQTCDLSTQVVNLTGYNQALLMATQEYDNPNPNGTPFLFGPPDPINYPGRLDWIDQVALDATNGVANDTKDPSGNAVKAILKQPPLNHLIINPNKPYNTYLKSDLIGTYINGVLQAPGALLLPTVFWANTHGITSGGGVFGAISGTCYGFRPSYVDPEDYDMSGCVTFDGGAASGQTYTAVYGSGTMARQVPPVNLVLMFSCNTMPIDNSYDGAQAFGIIPNEKDIVLDRAYLGFIGTLSAGQSPNLAQYCVLFAQGLKGGKTIQQICDDFSKIDGYSFVRAGEIRGDPLTRLAYAYLSAAERISAKKTTWLNSWYYIPTVQGNTGWPAPPPQQQQQ